LQVAVVIVGERLVAEGELAVAGVVARRRHRLRHAGPGPAPADLGPVAGFVVFVSQIAHHRRAVLLIRDTRHPRCRVVPIFYPDIVGQRKRRAPVGVVVGVAGYRLGQVIGSGLRFDYFANSRASFFSVGSPR